MDQQTPTDLLRIDETVGLAFTRGTKGNLCARANPQARMALNRILDNRELSQYHENAWRLLGYIGDRSDVVRLETALWNDFDGPLRRSEWRVVCAMFDAVGLLAHRNVEGAEELADRMMTPEYWRNARFRWYAEATANRHEYYPKYTGGPGFVYFTLYQFMLGYSLSLDPEMREKVALVRQRIGEPDESQFGTYFANESFFDPVIFGDSLLTNGRNARKDEDQPVTAGQRWLAWSHFNGDFENPGPAIPPRPIPQNVDVDAPPPIPASETPEQKLKRLAYRYSLNAHGKIAHVDFYGKEVNDETLQLLKAAPQLEHLSLINSPITDAGLSSLPDLPRLRSLSLVRTEATDGGLVALLGMPQLEKLYLSRSERFTDRALEFIGRSKSLTRLELDSLPNISEDGLRHLASLRQLNTLELQKLSVGDGGLAHLQPLKNLQDVRLNSLPIDGEGLHNFKDLPRLKSLVIRGAMLSDEGVKNLKQLTQLEQLALVGLFTQDNRARISEQTVRELQQALPNTEIISPYDLP